MLKFLGYFFLAALVIYIIQLALIVGLIIVAVAGLIFRPKQTLSLLALFGFIALVSAFPIPTLIGLGLLAIIGAILTAREKKAKQATPFPDGS